MQNYTIIENEDITNLNITDGAYRCYNLLLSMCHNKDYCYPSLKYLAQALGRSVKTIYRYINELVANNLIAKRRRGSISNVYTVFAKVKQFFNSITHTVAEKTKDLKTTTAQKNATVGQNNPMVKEHRSVVYKKKKKVDNFCNYPQREYDFDKLERQLLGWE